LDCFQYNHIPLLFYARTDYRLLYAEPSLEDMLYLLSSETGYNPASYASRCIRRSLFRLKYLMPRIMSSCHAVCSLCSAVRARCGLGEAPAGRVPEPVSVFFHLYTKLPRFEAVLTRIPAISHLPTYAQSLPAVPAPGSSNGFPCLIPHQRFYSVSVIAVDI